MTAWSILLAATVTMPDGGGAAPAPSIVVRDGQFVVRETGERFRPLGFNYVRLFNNAKMADHDNFSRTGYGANEHTAMLQRLAAGGFNTVRVFINFQTGEVIDHRKSTELSDVYLDNVSHFLRLARRHGVYVVLSMRQYPDILRYRKLRGEADPQVTVGNQHSLHPGWIRAKATYLQDFLNGLIDRDPTALAAVFAIDIQNEVCFFPGEKPFSLNAGSFTAPNGRCYDLATQKQNLADDSAVHYINTCAEAIDRAFPGVLINVNVFTFAAVGRTGPGDFHTDSAAWRNRVPFRPLAIANSQADMIDVHFYSDSLDQYHHELRSIEFDRLRPVATAAGKPLVVGEFGLFKSQFQDDFDAACRFLRDDWLPALNRDWEGWLYWTYDTHEQPRLWNAADHDFAIYKILASSLRSSDEGR